MISSRIQTTVAAVLLGTAPLPAMAQEAVETPVSDPMARVIEAVDEGLLGEVKAVIVEQGGEVLFERYFDGANADDRFDIRSAGKSITALALGRAIADGDIAGLDVAPLPQLGGSEEYGAIRLGDLVTMSSQLDCNDWDQKSPGHEDKMYPKRNWTRHALSIPLKDEYKRDQHGHGRFSYCTAGVFLTGQYIGQQTGQRFDAFVQSQLFDPLGITDVKWTYSPDGEAQAGGQIEMRARDLTKLARLVLNRGRYEGTQVVPASWIDEMLTPRVRATDSDDYGYLWWLRGYRNKEYVTPGWFMLGNGGNTIAIFEELDASVTVIATNYNRPGMHQIARDIIERGALPLLLQGQGHD